MKIAEKQQQKTIEELIKEFDEIKRVRAKKYMPKQSIDKKNQRINKYFDRKPDILEAEFERIEKENKVLMDEVEKKTRLSFDKIFKLLD